VLNKETFNQGISALTTEYKGFEMNRERSLQWYEFMKDMPEHEFQDKINSCLRNCNHVPYMADIMNARNDSIDSRPNSAAYEVI
jgi:hypothetical protein